MKTTARRRATIEASYATTFSRSKALSDRASRVLPSGIVHDGRYREPFPVYVESVSGSRKRTIDGVELVDYVMGHGSLMLGYNPDYAVEVLDRCNRSGSHMSGCHPGEVEWAEQICRLVPSAELVRFTLTGTEATQLAFRVARAATGRTRILRLTGHYHGWHDYGLAKPDQRDSAAGVPDGTLATLAFADPDPASVEAALGQDPCAAIVLEPSGAAAGAVPLDRPFLIKIRELADRAGALLIFDEVITGFRWAPGGAQEWHGVKPDVTTLGKIVAGGMPGAAVAGRRDVLAVMEHRADPEWNQVQRVVHKGTYNAFHHSAALGTATLERLSGGEVQNEAADAAETLRDELQRRLRRSGLSGCVYGDRSCIHFIVDWPGALPDLPPPEFVRAVPAERLLRSTSNRLRHLFWSASLLEGLDWMAGAHGWVSAAHSAADLELTADAFERALRRVTDEMELHVSDGKVAQTI